MPNWQSQLFISNYQSAISALVAHVSQAPYSSKIGYIRIGLSKGGEINLPSGWNNASTGGPCYGGYAGKWNYTQNTWQNYLQSMVQWENTTLNSQFPVLVSITPISGIGIAPDDFIAQVAFQNGISYGNQGLEASDITNFNAGQPCGGDWCYLFNKYPVAIRELQTLGPSCPQGTGACSGQQGSTGPLPPLLQFAAGLGGVGIPLVPTAANDLELYSDDWLIAYDPTDANHATYGAAYAAAIEAAAATGAKMQVLFPDPSSNIPSAVLPQSSVSGVVIDVDWSDFQPSSSSSSPDWTITDASINFWASHLSGNQKVNLVFQNTTYGGSNCSGSSGVGSHGQDGSGNCAMPPWMWTVLQ